MRYKILRSHLFEVARKFSIKLLSHGPVWIVIEIEPAVAVAIVFEFGQVISEDKLEWEE